MIQRLGTLDLLDVFALEELLTAVVPLPLILPRTLPTASVVTSSPAPVIHFLIRAAAFWCEGDR